MSNVMRKSNPQHLCELLHCMRLQCADNARLRQMFGTVRAAHVLMALIALHAQQQMVRSQARIVALQRDSHAWSCAGSLQQQYVTQLLLTMQQMHMKHVE